MKRMLKYLKNKYILTFVLFLFYALILDDVDVFSIIRQNKKLHQIEASKKDISQKLKATEQTLQELKTTEGKVRFAREKKFFKKDDEDIFVITYE